MSASSTPSESPAPELRLAEALRAISDAACAEATARAAALHALRWKTEIAPALNTVPDGLAERLRRAVQRARRMLVEKRDGGRGAYLQRVRDRLSGHFDPLSDYLPPEVPVPAPQPDPAALTLDRLCAWARGDSTQRCELYLPPTDTARACDAAQWSRSVLTPGVARGPVRRMVLRPLSSAANPYGLLKALAQDAAPGDEWVWIEALPTVHREPRTFPELLLALLQERPSPPPHAAPDRETFQDAARWCAAVLCPHWGEPACVSAVERDRVWLGVTFSVRSDTGIESAAGGTPNPVREPEPGPLFLLHSDPFLSSAGGTELHLRDRVGALRLPVAWVLYPVSAYALRLSRIERGAWDAAGHFDFPLPAPVLPQERWRGDVDALLELLLRALRAPLVVIDHLLNWPPSVRRRLARLEVPAIVVAHDYFALCPSHNLLHAGTQQLCGAHGSPGPRGASGTAACEADACMEAFAERSGCPLRVPGRDILALHQHGMGELLERADAVAAPDDSVLARLQERFPSVAQRFHVIPHGHPLAPLRNTLAPPAHGERWRVAVLGRLDTAIKGRDRLREVIELSAALPVEWHVFGAFDVAALRSADRGRVVNHGPYSRTEIVAHLERSGCQLAYFPALVPESFSLTLSEVWCAGLPALVPDLGALGARVRSSGAGWLVPPDSSRAAVERLAAVIATAGEYAAVQARVAQVEQLTVEQNAERYAALFCLEKRNVPAALKWPLANWFQRARHNCEQPGAGRVLRTGTWTLSADAFVRIQHLALQTGADGVELQPQGADPALELTPLLAVQGAGAEWCLRVELEAERAAVAQLYIGAHGTGGFSETRSLRLPVRAGQNSLRFVWRDPLFDGRLRFDPGQQPQRFVLRALEWSVLEPYSLLVRPLPVRPPPVRE